MFYFNAGKYLTIPRTEGISTTDIVGRMLLMTRDHHSTNLPTIEEEAPASANAHTGSVNSNMSSGGGNSPTHAHVNSGGNYKLASKDSLLHSASGGGGASERGTGSGDGDSSSSSSSGGGGGSGASTLVTTAPMPFIRKSRFLTTSRTIRLFGAGVTVGWPFVVAFYYM